MDLSVQFTHSNRVFLFKAEIPGLVTCTVRDDEMRVLSIGGIVQWVKIEPHIWAVETNPLHRRKGHAYRLLAEVCKKLAELGHRRVSLRVYQENEPAQALYRKLGFEVTDTTHWYWTMTKELT